jgi:hypothetical protein
VVGGVYTRTSLRAQYKIRDDAGNVKIIESEKPLLFTNDNRVQHGGDGGTSNLHRSDGGSYSEERRAVVREMIQQERAAAGDQDETEIFAPLNPDDVPVLNDYLQRFQEQFDSVEKQQMQEALESLPSYKEPDYLEHKYREQAFRTIPDRVWERGKDDTGGFRVQNTINKLKNQYKKGGSQLPSSLRITELANRGKKGKIRYENDFYTVREQ